MELVNSKGVGEFMSKCPEQESNGVGLLASVFMVILCTVVLLAYAYVCQSEKESTANGSESIGSTEASREIVTVPAEFCNTSYDDGVGVFTCRFVVDIAGVSHTLYYMEITRDWDKVMRLQGVDKVLEGKSFEVEYNLTDLSVCTAKPLDYLSIYDVY